MLSSSVNLDADPAFVAPSSCVQPTTRGTPGAGQKRQFSNRHFCQKSRGGAVGHNFSEFLGLIHNALTVWQFVAISGKNERKEAHRRIVVHRVHTPLIRPTAYPKAHPSGTPKNRFASSNFQCGAFATARVCTSVASLVAFTAVPGGPDIAQACVKGTPRFPLYEIDCKDVMVPSTLKSKSCDKIWIATKSRNIILDTLESSSLITHAQVERPLLLQQRKSSTPK